MILPEASDLSLLLIRTDYVDDEAWKAALAAATAVYDAEDFDRRGALLQPVESPELEGLSVAELVALPREGYLAAIVVADSQTMRDHTLLFVDLNEFSNQIGRSFRSIPWEAEPIVGNLSIANMDFDDFADSVGLDGVFRGFRSRYVPPTALSD